MNTTIKSGIKILLAILFLLCLADMPYGYYQFIRFAAMVGFILLAADAGNLKQSQVMIIYFSLALLFQPFIKIALGRSLWNVIDVFVSIGLIISIFYTMPINQKK